MNDDVELTPWTRRSVESELQTRRLAEDSNGEENREYLTGFKLCGSSQCRLGRVFVSRYTSSRR